MTHGFWQYKLLLDIRKHSQIAVVKPEWGG